MAQKIWKYAQEDIVSSRTMMKQVSQASLNGWELVQILPTTEERRFERAIFKRILLEESPVEEKSQ